jgi:hypothetical protein
MEALRIIVESADKRIVIDLPAAMHGRRFEVIVLPMVEDQPAPSPARRRPHPSLAGKTEIVGDIMAPAVPEEDWDALR